MGPKEKSFWKLYSHFGALTGSRKLVLRFFLKLANIIFLEHWHIYNIIPSLIIGTSSWEAASKTQSYFCLDEERPEHFNGIEVLCLFHKWFGS